MRGDSVDKPLPVGSSVDEIFGLPPILPLEVSWTCTADGNPLIFNAPEGLAGIAENCCMEFTATPDGSSTNIELVMSYDPVSPLADIASPILAIDNAIALKLTLPSNSRRSARRTRLLVRSSPLRARPAYCQRKKRMAGRASRHRGPNPTRYRSG